MGYKFDKKRKMLEKFDRTFKKGQWVSGKQVKEVLGISKTTHITDVRGLLLERLEPMDKNEKLTYSDSIIYEVL